MNEQKKSDRFFDGSPDWVCPHCGWVNNGIREICRNFECGYDSNAGEFPWYNPLPPYNGLGR